MAATESERLDEALEWFRARERGMRLDIEQHWRQETRGHRSLSDGQESARSRLVTARPLAAREPKRPRRTRLAEWHEAMRPARARMTVTDLPGDARG
jgi:hypothetical protein